MRLGERLSYLSASATVGQSGINLVPDANGRWVDINSHQVLQEGEGSGGAGVSVFDICQFTGSHIVANQTNYLLNTVTNSITLASHNVLQGNGKTLDVIWARPANFRSIKDQEEEGLRVRHITYTLDGRKFNAIRIQTNTGNGWTQSTYDLDTGLLLIQSQAVQIAGGGTGLAYMRLTSAKLLTGVPGIGTSWPAAVTRFHTYTWDVKGAGGVAGAGTISGQTTLAYRNMCWAGAVLTTDVFAGTQAQGKQQFVAGSVGSVWMSPAFLQRLRQGQVIDAENALQYGIAVSAVDQSTVTITFATKTQRVDYVYNRASGDLVAFTIASSEGLYGSGAQATFVSRG